jgi:hypothetical protein
VEFYIKDGKAYYYNNVRTILEAQDCAVAFDKGTTGKGRGFILYATAASNAASQTLKEGTDYIIGYDGKAHFTSGGTLPPGAEKPAPTPAPQQTSSGQTGAGNATSTQTPNDYGFIWITTKSYKIIVGSILDMTNNIMKAAE